MIIGIVLSVLLVVLCYTAPSFMLILGFMWCGWVLFDAVMGLLFE